MSEELKHYEIQVGTQTRAGNLNVAHRFIAMSDKNMGSVRSFYASKYSGLTVYVQLITEVVSDNIPVVNNSYSYDNSDDKILNLKRQIESLNKERLDRFSGEISTDKLDSETRTLIKELKEILNLASEKESAIASRVKKFISEKYGSSIIYEVGLDSFNPMARDLKFTARLRGKIYRSPLKNK